MAPVYLSTAVFTVKSPEFSVASVMGHKPENFSQFSLAFLQEQCYNLFHIAGVVQWQNISFPS